LSELKKEAPIKRRALKNGFRIAASALFFVFLEFVVLSPAASAEEASRLIEALMGPGKTENINGRPWTADLGVMAYHSQKVYILAGDTIGLDIFSPNSIATSTDLQPQDGFSSRWNTYLNGNPVPFFPRIDPDSTVPAGALSLNGILYVFMMDVTHWGDLSDLETRARPALIKSTDNGAHFSLIWLGLEESKFVNIAPVLGPHPADSSRQVVYFFGSGKYRESPVYLAYAEIGDIEYPNRYFYYKGLQNNTPLWSPIQNEAVPIVSGVKVGELSVAWNDYLQKYILAFFDFAGSPYGFYFRISDKPWGKWSTRKLIFDGTQKPDWYETGWRGPYGGYLLRELSRESGRIIYFTLSLWIPYNIFLMELDLREVFAKKGVVPR